MGDETTTSRILLVEDEKSLRNTLQLNLHKNNYEVQVAVDGAEALEYHENQRFDLIILDIMLPKIDGFRVCERIRLEDEHTPILFLTAKAESEDRVMGLKKGGDDYLVKPFNLEELLLRVDNLLKRSQQQSSAKSLEEQYSFGDNTVEFTTYTAYTASETIELSKKEVKLLKLLIDREGEVVSREEILEAVWGYDVYPTTRTIDNYILSFRKYFEKDPKNPVFFRSVRGVGYKFVNPTESN